VSSTPQRVTYEATIERIDEIAPATRSFILRLPAAVRFVFKPGQFISCLLPVGGETIIRPYSIASSPEDTSRLEICLNRVPNGPGSHYLFSLASGATVRFTGPWGTFFLTDPPTAECVFIAAGTAIAPIRPMLWRALTGATAPVRLHYATASAAHLLYRAEFQGAASTNDRFTFTPLVGGSLIDAITRRYVSDDGDRSRHFYICGVGGIVAQLRDLLRRCGYERRAVQYEQW
jgi:ferredoxin-NADP reductase